MSVRRPYYAIHQILTGQYTSGGEYYRESGEVYRGPYHVLPNEQVFTGFVPNRNSEELFVLSAQLVQESQYRKITKIKTGKYLSPRFYFPQLSEEEINQGFFVRYFVQQKNSPRSTIVEIDEDQFNGVNLVNGPGINGALWRKTSLQWLTRATDADTLATLNANTLFYSEQIFPGITQYLSNLIEFAQ